MHELGPIGTLVMPMLQRARLSSGGNIIACCPFHDDRRPSFSIHSETGYWICFGCGLRGGIERFLELQHYSKSRIEQELGPLRAELQQYRQTRKRQEARRFQNRDPFLADPVLDEALTGIFYFQPRALERDFDSGLLKSYGIGYDRSADRIMFPIRDLYGNLAGYSGRAVKEGEQIRYKVYTGAQQETVFMERPQCLSKSAQRLRRTRHYH